jgi:hypothetical protein
MDRSLQKTCRIPVTDAEDQCGKGRLQLGPILTSAVLVGLALRHGRHLLPRRTTPVTLVRKVSLSRGTVDLSVVGMIRRFGRPTLRSPLAYQVLATKKPGGFRTDRHSRDQVRRIPLGQRRREASQTTHLRVASLDAMWKRSLYHVQQTACGYPLSNATSCHRCCATTTCLNPLFGTGFE